MKSVACTIGSRYRLRAILGGLAIAFAISACLISIAPLADPLADGGGPDATNESDAGDAATEPPVCDGGLTACGSFCVDLRTDRANCGGCTHDCLVTGCDAGLCKPTTLAQNLKAPQLVLVNGSDVYFSTYGDHTVSRVDADGGIPEILVPNQVEVSRLVLSGDTLYWCDFDSYVQGYIGTLPLDGGPYTVSVVSNMTALSDIALSGQSIYFTSFSNFVGKTPLAIVDGGPVTLLTSPPDSFYIVHPTTLGIAGEVIYVGIGPSLRSVPIDGGGSTPVLQGLHKILDIATNGDALFFVDQDDAGSIDRLPFGASVVQALAPAMVAQHLTVDEQFVYFTEATGGFVKKVPLAGGPTTILAVGEAKPSGISVDGTMVYWATESGGTIRKVAK